MGVDPISISALIAQQVAAAAAAAQAAVASAAGAVGIGGGTAGAGGLGTAGTTAAGGFTPGLAGSTSAIAGVGPQAGGFGLAKGAEAAAAAAATDAGVKAGLTPGKAAATAASAAAPAAAEALKGKPDDPAAPKVEAPGVANASAGMAADRERRKRAPGRASTLLTSPLGLSTPAAGKARSPGVAALAGTLG